MAAAQGEPVHFTEEEHRVMQEALNSGQRLQDEEPYTQAQVEPVKMRRKADSLDVLFTAPNIKGFFKKREFSYLSWATLIVLLITVLLLLVMMAAPGWGWTKEISGSDIREGEMYGKYGLWYVCYELVDSPGKQIDCELLSKLGVPGWFNGVQAMVVLCMIATVIAMANSAAYICAKSLNGNPMLIASVVVLSSLAALFGIGAFVMFAVQFLQEAYWCCKSGKMQVLEWHLYYCFILCCVVPASCLVGALLASGEVARLRAIVRKARYAAELDEKRQSGNYEGYGYPYNMGYGYGYGQQRQPYYPQPQYSGYSNPQHGRMY